MLSRGAEGGGSFCGDEQIAQCRHSSLRGVLWRQAAAIADSATHGESSACHLKKSISKGLWIRHVKGHSKHVWNNIADKLAGDGNFKRRTYCGPPWGLGPLIGGH